MCIRDRCYTLVVAISSSFRPKQLEAYSHKDKEKLIELLKNSMLITGTAVSYTHLDVYKRQPQYNVYDALREMYESYRNGGEN